MKLTIQTSSMEPEFHIGDVIAVDTEFDPQELVEGDIIAFKLLSDGEEITMIHRIIRIEEADGKRYFQTQGDNRDVCLVPDFVDGDLLTEDKIVGKFDHIIYSKKR